MKAVVREKQEESMRVWMCNELRRNLGPEAQGPGTIVMNTPAPGPCWEHSKPVLPRTAATGHIRLLDT